MNGRVLVCWRENIVHRRILEPTTSSYIDRVRAPVLNTIIYLFNFDENRIYYLRCVQASVGEHIMCMLMACVMHEFTRSCSQVLAVNSKTCTLLCSSEVKKQNLCILLVIQLSHFCCCCKCFCIFRMFEFIIKAALIELTWSNIDLAPVFFVVSMDSWTPINDPTLRRFEHDGTQTT